MNVEGGREGSSNLSLSLSSHLSLFVTLAMSYVSSGRNIVNAFRRFFMTSREENESLIPPCVDPKDRANALQRRRCLRNSPESAVIHPFPDRAVIPSQLPPSLKSEPTFRKISLVFAAYLGIGTLCFYLLRHHIAGKKTSPWLDALYFCIVTMTTVGYGDLVPDSTLSRMLASIYVFAGVAFVGFFLGKAADYLVEKQEAFLVRAIHIHEKLGPVEFHKEAECHKTRYKLITCLILLLLLILLGILFLCLVEELQVVDAFYCVCATITTLGYGDESFSTEAGRGFAVFWILSSTVCLAQFFFYLAEINTENRQKMLVKRVLSREVTSSDLEAADLDLDKVIR